MLLAPCNFWRCSLPCHANVCLCLLKQVRLLQTRVLKALWSRGSEPGVVHAQLPPSWDRTLYCLRLSGTQTHASATSQACAQASACEFKWCWSSSRLSGPARLCNFPGSHTQPCRPSNQERLLPIAASTYDHLGLGHEPVAACITFGDVPAADPVEVDLVPKTDPRDGARTLHVLQSHWQRATKALYEAAEPHQPRRLRIMRTSEPGSTPLALRLSLFTADGLPVPPLDVELKVRLLGRVWAACMAAAVLNAKQQAMLLSTHPPVTTADCSFAPYKSLSLRPHVQPHAIPRASAVPVHDDLALQVPGRPSGVHSDPTNIVDWEADPPTVQLPLMKLRARSYKLFLSGDRCATERLWLAAQ